MAYRRPQPRRRINPISTGKICKKLTNHRSYESYIQLINLFFAGAIMVKSLLQSTLLGAAAVAAAAGSAEANIVEVVTINSLLQSGGGNLNGQFNVGSQLASSPTPQVVTGGSLIVYGTSAPIFQSSTSTQYQTTNSYWYQTGGGYYVSGCWWCSGYYVPPTYANHTDVNATSTTTRVDGQVDTLNVSVGATSQSASDTYKAPTSSGLLYQGSYTTGNYYSGSTTYYNYTQTIESGYYGQISATLALQQSDIDALNQTGLLNFILFASNGQMNVGSATLNLLTADAQTPAGAVPELPTWLMMLAGFGALGVAYNRRRQRSKTTTVMV